MQSQIYITPKGSYSFLTENDIFQEGDLVRHTYSGFNEYAGRTMFNWMSVESYMPYWIGKTLKEYFSGIPYPIEVIRKI